ncbi:hypothetical protein [Chromobacterium sp. CV08]|uniref:hypothetical protein n=1 Tax=Chromobacterium sp. CV08 TaxID=3133274 RepID=UPI003DA9D24F
MSTLDEIKRRLSAGEGIENMHTSMNVVLDATQFLMGKAGLASFNQAFSNAWSSTGDVLEATPSSSLIKNMGYRSLTDLLDQNTSQQ